MRGLIFTVLFAAMACGDDSATSTVAPWPTAQWATSTPDAQGMDAAGIDESLDYAFAQGKNSQGVVVIRNGYVVAERYAEGRDQDSWAGSWSMAKSYAGALIGIAIEEGDIEGVDVPMSHYYPSWEGTGREKITLEHILNMASGLDWSEDYAADSPDSDVIAITVQEKDHLDYAVTRRAEKDPGKEFRYSSGDSMLLSGLIEKATGMTPAKYAAEKLFGPLGTEQVDWWSDAAGNTLTYCCLDMPAREFAKFGLLYMNGGEWDGEQVVPASWVEDSLVPSDTSDNYGYQIWLSSRSGDALPDDLFSARGHDGQYIYVVPSEALVVVRNSIYDKFDGDPVGEPFLWFVYPNEGRGDGVGTQATDSWDDLDFLRPILRSIED